MSEKSAHLLSIPTAQAVLESVSQKWDPEFGSLSVLGIPATGGAGSAIVASAVKCVLYFLEEAMIRSRKFSLVAAALIGAAMLAAATQARADFELQVSTTGAGGPFTTYYSIDGGASWWTGPGDTGTSPGSSVVADQLRISASSTDFTSMPLSTLDLQVGGTQDMKTYNLVVQATITSVPTQYPPQFLNWHFTSSSDDTPTPLTETGQGWVDSNNQDFGTGSIIANTGPLSAPAKSTSPGTQFNDPNPYSWTVQYTLVGAGALGDNISADDNQKITGSPNMQITGTPAPAGMILAISGLPVLSLGVWLRRRRIVLCA